MGRGKGVCIHKLYWKICRYAGIKTDHYGIGHRGSNHSLLGLCPCPQEYTPVYHVEVSGFLLPNSSRQSCTLCFRTAGLNLILHFFPKREGVSMKKNLLDLNLQD